MKRRHQNSTIFVREAPLAFNRAVAQGALVIAAAFGLTSTIAWPLIADSSTSSAQTGTFEVEPVLQMPPGQEAVLVKPSAAGAFTNEVIGFNSQNELYVDSVSLSEQERIDAQQQKIIAAGDSGAVSRGQRSSMFGSQQTLLAGEVGQIGELPGGLQLMHPVTTRSISSPYGWRSNPTGAGNQIHIGQDYPIACGSPVYASEAGTVVVSGWAGHSGNRVTIDHGNNVQTGYSHNSKLIAKVGQQVQQGELIALAGTTGNSTGCHVHFEVIIDGRWHDPRNYLPVIPGQRQAMIDSSRLTVNAGSAPKGGGSTPEVRDRDDTSSNPDVVVPKDDTPVVPKPKPSVKPKPVESSKPSQKPSDSPSLSESESGKPSGSPSQSPSEKPSETPSKSPKPSQTQKPTSPSTDPQPTESALPTAPTESAEPESEPSETSKAPVETEASEVPEGSEYSQEPEKTAEPSAAPSSKPAEPTTAPSKSSATAKPAEPKPVDKPSPSKVSSEAPSPTVKATASVPKASTKAVEVQKSQASVETQSVKAATPKGTAKEEPAAGKSTAPAATVKQQPKAKP